MTTAQARYSPDRRARDLRRSEERDDRREGQGDGQNDGPDASTVERAIGVRATKATQVTT